MDCKQFESNIAAYAEGTIPEHISRLMETHRLNCQTCESLARVHEFVLHSLDETEHVKAPAGLADKILATAQAEAVQSQRVPFPWRSLVPQLAAAAAMFFAGFYMFSENISNVFNKLSGSLPNEPTQVVLSKLDISNIFSRFGSISIPEAWLDVLKGGIGLINQSVALPYLSYQVPIYYFAALGILAWTTWMYFSSDKMPATIHI